MLPQRPWLPLPHQHLCKMSSTRTRSLFSPNPIARKSSSLICDYGKLKIKVPCLNIGIFIFRSFDSSSIGRYYKLVFTFVDAHLKVHDPKKQKQCLAIWVCIDFLAWNIRTKWRKIFEWQSILIKENFNYKEKVFLPLKNSYPSLQSWFVFIRELEFRTWNLPNCIEESWTVIERTIIFWRTVLLFVTCIMFFE